MKLFIKGKMFDHLDKMAVTGENGEALYYLERDTSAKGHMVTVTGADSKKLGDIEQRGTTGLVSFAVLKVALLKSELDIADDADPVAVLAIVLAIRNVLFRASIVGTAATTAGITIHS